MQRTMENPYVPGWRAASGTPRLGAANAVVAHPHVEPARLTSMRASEAVSPLARVIANASRQKARAAHNCRADGLVPPGRPGRRTGSRDHRVVARSGRLRHSSARRLNNRRVPMPATLPLAGTRLWLASAPRPLAAPGLPSSHGRPLANGQTELPYKLECPRQPQSKVRVPRVQCPAEGNLQVGYSATSASAAAVRRAPPTLASRSCASAKARKKVACRSVVASNSPLATSCSRAYCRMGSSRR